jgi:hypothetical protein
MKHKREREREREREFDTSYFHNPIVQRVNYSLFIMLLKKMALKELKGQPGAASPASPLLSLKSIDMVCVFCISSLPHHKIARGVLYIVGFMLV